MVMMMMIMMMMMIIIIIIIIISCNILLNLYLARIRTYNQLSTSRVS